MAIESQGTVIQIGTGSGGAETITAMTLSNPTVLTSVAHSLNNGDVATAALFAGADAASINAIDWVIKYVTDDTFAIELDSTDLTIDDNTDSATMTPVAYTSIGEVTDFDGPSGTASVIDVTHLGSTAKEKLMGLPDEGQFTFSINWDQDDAGQQAAIAARAARTEEDFKVTYSDTSTATFSGFVLGVTSSGGVDGKVSGSMTVEITGAVTFTPAA